MDLSGKYETVIGLEVHAQLLTQSKLFSGDSAAFGGDPNTHISPITLGHPGTLPKMNKNAIEMALKMGLACECDISKENYFARKHYFYPDLPKGYQISQHTTPICNGGVVKIKTESGEKLIRLNRIHMEEDAGKSMHDQHGEYSFVDYNRAGVSLIEIVTEPDLSSGEEAYAFLTELRKLVRFLGICDGNMEEGSLRCDANISIRTKGATALGTKVEVKNLNSIRFVKKAIEFEANRMMAMAEHGETILQQTRSYDADNDNTFVIRTKEEANDYRYFADPDLTPFSFSDEYLQSIKIRLPALPHQLEKKFVDEFSLPEYDARQLSEEKETGDYFLSLVTSVDNKKAAANWILGPVRSYMNDKKLDWQSFDLDPIRLAGLIALVEKGKLSFSIASQKVLPVLIEEKVSDAEQIAAKLNLFQDTNETQIEEWVVNVLSKFPDKADAYRNGKKGLQAFFVGEVMKISKGKAEPKLTNRIIQEKLKV